MLEPVAEGLLVATRRLRFAGVEVGTRMTVVVLREGGLFVHSPVALDPATRRAVDALGPVRVVVAPSRFHHLHVGEWSAAYPGALLCACPGLERKRPDVRWARILGESPEPEWREDLDQVFFRARSLENEIVFFHRATRTLVCADALFDLARHPSRATRLVAFLLGNRRPGPTWVERFLVRDRAAAREQIDRMLAWDADRIVLAHGEIVRSGAREVLRRAYAWV